MKVEIHSCFEQFILQVIGLIYHWIKVFPCSQMWNSAWHIVHYVTCITWYSSSHSLNWPPCWMSLIGRIFVFVVHATNHYIFGWLGSLAIHVFEFHGLLSAVQTGLFSLSLFSSFFSLFEFLFLSSVHLFVVKVLEVGHDYRYRQGNS